MAVSAFRFGAALVFVGIVTASCTAAGAPDRSLPQKALPMDRVGIQGSLPDVGYAQRALDRARRALPRPTEGMRPLLTCPTGPGIMACIVLAEGQSKSFNLTGSDANLQYCHYRAQWDDAFGGNPTYIKRTYSPAFGNPTPHFTTKVTVTALPGSAASLFSFYIEGEAWITTTIWGCPKPYYDYGQIGAWPYMLRINVLTRSEAIYEAALAQAGQGDTKYLPAGADCGTGCVYTVNGIVHDATGQWLCNDPGAYSTDQLDHENGRPVCSNLQQKSQSETIPGDLIIVDSTSNPSDAHVGICLNAGCTEMNSNSSTHCTFTFGTPTYPNFVYPGNGGPYANGTVKYWRMI